MTAIVMWSRVKH